jgi:hypothetical protein
VKPTKLFSVGQITAGCVFGSPALAGTLYGLNELRLGRRQRGAWVAGGSIAVTALLYAHWFLGHHPSDRWYWAIHIALTLLAWRLTRRFQTPDVNARLAGGAQKSSGWSVFALWLAEFVAIIGVGVFVYRHRSERFLREHPSVAVGSVRIFYRPPATPDDAEAVASLVSDLQEVNLLSHVQIERVDAGYALSFHETPGLPERRFKAIAALASHRLFQDRPVETRLCPSYFDYDDCKKID